MTTRLNGQELPSGWVWSTLSELCKINFRNPELRTLPDDLEVTFLPMAAVDAITGTITQPEIRRLGTVRKGFTPFVNNDVLFAKITPSMENGKAAIATDLVNGVGFGSTEFHVLSPTEHISPKWVFYYIRQSSFRADAKANFSGTAGQLRVPTDFLTDYPIPHPPLNEQHRIVAAIETQFTRLDAAVTALKRSQANLKRYRAAVLKAACEGRLVPTEAALAQAEGRSYEPASALLERILAERRRKWAAENPKKKYQEPVAPDTSALPELPEGWCWAYLPHLGELNRGKSKHRPRNDERLFGGPYPFIQTGDIRHANGVLTSYSQTYSEIGLKQSRLWPAGTLCITIAANIAETAILGFDACFPDSVVGFIPSGEGCNIQFVEYFFRTVRQDLETFAPATAQKNINLEILSELAISLLPLAEQQRIVAEVERRLSLIDQLEKTIETDLARANRLRQSILQRAFAGQLVPQDPSDEPASLLLERIQAAKHGQPVQTALL